MTRRNTSLIISLLIVGGFFLGRNAGRLPLPIVTVRFTSEVPSYVEESKGEMPSGDEVVLVYIGSPTCDFCTRPEMANLVREAASILRREAAGDGSNLVSVGVSPNWIPGKGWRFLERIMNFDEVIIGRNWLNSEIVELVWSSPEANVGTPQIIVYRQTVVPPSENGRASISREEPVARVSGLDGIRHWVESGCPLEWRGG